MPERTPARPAVDAGAFHLNAAGRRVPLDVNGRMSPRMATSGYPTCGRRWNAADSGTA